MKLTDKDKAFIIRNGDTLQELFLRRIEDLKEEITYLQRGVERDAKIELIQEFRAWLKDFRAITHPESVKKNKLI